MSWHGKADQTMVLGSRSVSRCYRRQITPTLDERGWQGVVYSRAPAVDVFRQLFNAMRHAGLVGTAVRRRGQTRAGLALCDRY